MNRHLSTIPQLMRRVHGMIEDDGQLARDIAAKHDRPIGEISDEPWFHLECARHYVMNVGRYGHLKESFAEYERQQLSKIARATAA